jgi:hypothetical protein
MLIINFGHPLTKPQQDRIAELVGRPIDRVIPVTTQFDNSRPFAEQVSQLLGSTGLTSEQWQTTPMIVNLPSLAPIAAVLLAELHGRTGFFPTIVRLRPMPGTTPSQFEVDEVVNLQPIRDAARGTRC